MLQKISYYISLNQKKLLDMARDYGVSKVLPDRKALSRSKINYTIVKEYSTSKSTHIDRIGQGTYTYNQDLDKFDWKLQEQKKYWAITVKKATTEFWEGYVAWYTTEISIADGPYKFMVYRV
jgi:GLPGLI family protein